MPTYKNETHKPICTTEGMTSRVVQVNEQIETLYLLDNLGFTKVADTPYYNPVSDVKVFTTGNNNIVDIVSRYIRITVASGVGNIYFTSKSNTPGIPFIAGDTIKLELYNQVEKIIVEFTSNGSVKVSQLNQDVFK